MANRRNYTSFDSRPEAERSSKLALMLLIPDTYQAGKGGPPGRGAHKLPPGKGFTTMYAPVKPGRDGKFYVESLPALPERSADIDGIRTAPPRGGESRDDDDFVVEGDVMELPDAVRVRE